MKFLADTKIPEHPYPELRKVLNTFVDEIAAKLRENLVGIYLIGSIASGDFDLDSDVDFLVVTNTELTEANMKSLQDIQIKGINLGASPEPDPPQAAAYWTRKGIKIHDIDCYPAKH